MPTDIFDNSLTLKISLLFSRSMRSTREFSDPVKHFLLPKPPTGMFFETNIVISYKLYNSVVQVGPQYIYSSPQTRMYLDRPECAPYIVSRYIASVSPVACKTVVVNRVESRFTECSVRSYTYFNFTPARRLYNIRIYIRVCMYK